GAEVAVALDEGIAHGEILGQADQGVVDAAVAVGVVFAQHVAHAGGGFFEGVVGGEAAFVHGVQNAPVDRLQAVPHVGQSAARYDGHGVFDVRLFHFGNQI